MIRFFFILPIKFYQFCISPLLGASCRFEPSCSNYVIDAIREYGVIKGLLLSLKTIMRCHPMGDVGYDPVKKKE